MARRQLPAHQGLLNNPCIADEHHFYSFLQRCERVSCRVSRTKKYEAGEGNLQSRLCSGEPRRSSCRLEFARSVELILGSDRVAARLRLRALSPKKECIYKSFLRDIIWRLFDTFLMRAYGSLTFGGACPGRGSVVTYKVALDTVSMSMP